MKKLLTKSQKTASAIVALMLGAIITFSAVMNSFGVTNDTEFESNLLEDEILERAYTDVMVDEFEEVELIETHTIKVYDSEDQLIKTVELGDDEIIEDAETLNLVHQAEFLTEYNNTSIYRISK